MSAGPWSLFAACLPGLEPLLAAEIAALGAAPEPVAGGVAFQGGAALLRDAHLHLGCASQILLRVGGFHCRSLGELTRKTAQLPWYDCLRPDQPWRVHAAARRSRLFHTGAIAERVAAGVAAALGVPASPGDRGAQIAVRFLDDVATLSLETAATPLHRRGYRLVTGKAPLREDLAHALLRAAGFAPGTALLDPFCGAGTIAIEAAAIARALPPGRLLPAPLVGTALEDDAAWQRLVAAAGGQPQAAPVAASDRDQGAVASARANAGRAGVADAAEFSVAAFSSHRWFSEGGAPVPLLVATNPPFGRRVAAKDGLGALFQRLGSLLDRAQARTALLVHDPRSARKVGRPLEVAFTTRHGGLTVAAMVG